MNRTQKHTRSRASFVRVLAAAVTLCWAQVVAAGETITYFHNEIIGSPVVATDVNGFQVWKETYRPYGDQLIDAAASQNNKIGFAGKQFDDSTGLSYMGARYYDPTLGRFMAVDPMSFSFDNLHSFNRYAYANNNPYRYVDPSGEAAIPAVAVVVIGGGVLIVGCQASGSCERFGRAVWDLGQSLPKLYLTSTVRTALFWNGVFNDQAEEQGGSSSDSGSRETVDDVINDLEKGAKVSDKGSTADKGVRNIDKTGTGAKTQEDWKRLVGAAGGESKPIDTPWGPGEAIDLPGGGGSASVRPGSSGGSPTIQIDRPGLKPWKGRYDE